MLSCEHFPEINFNTQLCRMHTKSSSEPYVVVGNDIVQHVLAAVLESNDEIYL